MKRFYLRKFPYNLSSPVLLYGFPICQEMFYGYMIDEEISTRKRFPVVVPMICNESYYTRRRQQVIWYCENKEWKKFKIFIGTRSEKEHNWEMYCEWVDGCVEDIFFDEFLAKMDMTLYHFLKLNNDEQNNLEKTFDWYCKGEVIRKRILPEDVWESTYGFGIVHMYHMVDEKKYLPYGKSLGTPTNKNKEASDYIDRIERDMVNPNPTNKRYGLYSEKMWYKLK